MKRRFFFRSLLGAVAAFFARCEVESAGPVPSVPAYPLDMNGREIRPGAFVRIHYSEGRPVLARVVEADCSWPTVNEPGFYVELRERGRGQFGMMSYILEVV